MEPKAGNSTSDSKQARCRDIAARDGITAAQADNCWEGLVECSECPTLKRNV